MKLFEIGLFLLICLCLLVLAYYRFIKPEAAKRNPEPMALDYARSFFPVLALVFLLRSFVAEPFRIPSGSMLSNLEVGDFILVNKFSYGIRLPILHKKIIDTGRPDRGDIVVFRYPPDPSQNYIKRLIGLPGDKIEYDSGRKQLFVNDVLIEKVETGVYTTFGTGAQNLKYDQTIMRSDGTKVAFPILNRGYPRNVSSIQEWVVPEGHYFMMGDNRDNSLDSRSNKFTFVADENVVGKAFFIWMHYGFDRDVETPSGKVTIPGDGFKPSRIGDNISAREVE